MKFEDFVKDEYISSYYESKGWFGETKENFRTLINDLIEVLGEFDSYKGNPQVRCGFKEKEKGKKGSHLFHLFLNENGFRFGINSSKCNAGIEELNYGKWLNDKNNGYKKVYFNWDGSDFEKEKDNFISILRKNIEIIKQKGSIPTERAGYFVCDYPTDTPKRKPYFLDLFKELFEDKKNERFSLSEIITLMKEKYGDGDVEGSDGVKGKSITPKDYCYNCYNDSFKEDKDKFKRKAIFIFHDNGYEYVGSGHPYTGGILWDARDKYIGEWREGKIVSWFDKDEVGNQTGEKKMKAEQTTPLNAIYYGPPGTGKTYYTIEAAVKAAEPDFYSSLKNKELTEEERRSQLKDKYEALVAEKRIRFVTFHQSYGYEEFVEGLKAESDDGKINYKIEPGVFKKICNDASISHMDIDSSINATGRVWKISIEGTYSNERKTYCLENDIAAIGWDATGDLSSDVQNDYFSSLGKNDQKSLKYFSQEMDKGDLVLCIDSNTSVEAIGVVCGDYRFVEEGLYSGQGYCHQLPVKWLAKDFSVDFQEINGNKRFNLPTCYPLNRLSVSDTLAHLETNNIVLHCDKPQPERKNYVLIIDEINRGNISKIFGELITLIEPSKRKGKKEELEISLPHSKHKLFSVPDNLYIIGTMNTADRSLAMMDTALRRRFDFVEMMPKPKLFEGVVVQGIDIEALMNTLNKRIEVLYDREHTLGHAFFMPVKAALESEGEVAAFIELQLVFKNKVLPLLEEYFYEDWSKISLVLGDNQKKNEDLQFVRETEIEYDSLFGSGFQSDNYGQLENRYELALFSDDVWKRKQAYQAIYSPLSAINTTTSDEE